MRRHGYVLTPARYCHNEDIDDHEPLSDKMPRLQARLEIQLAESERLAQVIAENLRALGFGSADGVGVGAR